MWAWTRRSRTEITRPFCLLGRVFWILARRSFSWPPVSLCIRYLLPCTRNSETDSSDAFNKYKNYTGAQEDKDTGLLRITPAQYANLKSLYFTIGDVSLFELLYLHERLTCNRAGHLQADEECADLAARCEELRVYTMSGSGAN